MDELEIRTAALELVLMELLAVADPSILVGLSASIAEGLVGPGEPGFGGDEQTVRNQALTIVQDAKQRHVMFMPARRV